MIISLPSDIITLGTGLPVLLEMAVAGKKSLEVESVLECYVYAKAGIPHIGTESPSGLESYSTADQHDYPCEMLYGCVFLIFFKKPVWNQQVIFFW